MSAEMFMIEVFFGIGFGIGIILTGFGIYELYMGWKNGNKK